jgi:hypothetical protein
VIFYDNRLIDFVVDLVTANTAFDHAGKISADQGRAIFNYQPGQLFDD